MIKLAAFDKKSSSSLLGEGDRAEGVVEGKGRNHPSVSPAGCHLPEQARGGFLL
jgi:hypothetical protein